MVTLFVFKPECFCLFQGGDNNAEGTSPTHLLVGDDNAQSKILGLRRESLYTDGLDLVRSLCMALPLNQCCSV